MLLNIKKYQESIGYGLSLAVLFFLLQWLELKFLVFTHQYEIYFGFIAILFTMLGIWLAGQLTKPTIQTVWIENSFAINHNEIDSRKISKRELEVLTLIAAGKSNHEITHQLFVSVNTIKTHTGNLYEKLEVKRRTQAIVTAKKLQIIR